MGMGLQGAQGTCDGLVLACRGQRAQRLLHHFYAIRLAPERLPQALVERVALSFGHVVARGEGLREILTGVVEVQDLHQLCSGDFSQTAQALHPMLQPFGSISDKLHHVRIGGPEQSQIANEQRPNRLGVPKEHIIERQTQAIRLSLLVEDVDHQQPGLTPRGGKPVAPFGRLTPRPSKNGQKGSLFLPRMWTSSRGSRSALGPHSLWWCMPI